MKSPTDRLIISFQLTRLMRGVTIVWVMLILITNGFQLTRLMRGVTTAALYGIDHNSISTHTPHARRDVHILRRGHGLNISTHTPHARRDDISEIGNGGDENFNSHASCEA